MNTHSNKKKKPKLNTQQALQKLREIFERQGWQDCTEEKCFDAYDIIIDHPSLAKEQFFIQEGRGRGRGRDVLQFFPFYFFLHHPQFMTLSDQLKIIYDMNPHRHGDRYFLKACDDGVPLDVLVFLCKGYGKQLRARGKNPPIVYQMAEKLLDKLSVKYQPSIESEEDTKDLFQARMSKVFFIITCDKSLKTDILWIALDRDCTVQTLEAIVTNENYVPSNDDDDDDDRIAITSSAICEIFNSNILCPVLTPLLRKLHVEPRSEEGWSRSNFDLLWEIIQHKWDHKIEEMELIGLPSDALLWDSLFILDHDLITELRQVVSWLDVNHHPTATEKLALDEVTLFMSGPLEDSSQLSYFVSSIPLLRSLFVYTNKHTKQNWTNAVVRLLNLNRLNEFAMEDSKNENTAIDVDPIVEVLKTNTTLRDLSIWPKSFELSEIHLKQLVTIFEGGTNMTLGKLHCRTNNFSGLWGFGDPSKEFQADFLEHGTAEEKKLNYYLMLNQFDRATANDPQGTRGQYVDVLCRAANKRQEYSDTMFHSILYGLLRENPSIWCT